MNSLGKHILLEMYGCPFENLDNGELIVQAFKDAVVGAHMTMLGLNYHKFEPQGFTAVALLSESHMSIHTYPELGYAAVDVFTCGNEGNPFEAMNVLIRAVNPAKHSIIYVPRGLEVEQ